MPKAIIIPVIGLILVMGCTTPRQPLLNASLLPTAVTSIAADQPYLLKTTKGALIRIAANSFDVPAGTNIQLEVKEAYTLQDILLAGLSTMSDGRPLQSGGMIYFNATAGGKPVKFLKQVGITIPSSSYNPAMQLFKGEYKSDSTINWVNPTPLDTSPVSNRLKIGEALFKANCANCHQPTKDYTGPALAGARFRAPFFSWAAWFTDNVNTMLVTDPYAKRLLAKYGSRMTQFNLPYDDVNAILDYADNVAELERPGSLAKMASSKAYRSDSAGYAQRLLDSAVYTSTLDCGYDTLDVYNTIAAIPDSSAGIVKDTVQYVKGAIEQPVYAFEIDHAGWYNIDCFINNYQDQVQPVTLTAAFIKKMDVPMDVYLCIPSKKLLTEGHETVDGNIVFNYGDDSVISLIPGAKAYVFATGGAGEHYYYGIKSFTIADWQHLTIAVKEASREAIIKAFKKNTLEDVIVDPSRSIIENILPPPQQGSSGQPTADTTNRIIERQVVPAPCSPPLPGDSSLSK